MAKLERVKGMITIKVQIKITLGKGRLVTGREGVQGELLGACLRLIIGLAGGL